MNQQAPVTTERSRKEDIILTWYESLPENLRADLLTVILALAEMDKQKDPRIKTLVKFLDWISKRDPGEGRVALSLMASACNGNESAWGIMEGTLEEGEETE